MHRKRILNELRDFTLLIAVGFGLTWIGWTCRDCRDNIRDLMVMGSFVSFLWIVLWKGNQYLGAWISTKIPWLEAPGKRFAVGAISTVVFTLTATYILRMLYVAIFQQPLDASFVITVIIAVTISLFMYGYEFLVNWKASVVRAEQLRTESLQARYESLKHQVNPHFLFNSFNALTNLVYEDEEKAITFIDQLSLIYRYVLDTQEREKVPLEEELRFLDSYLYLQKIRFGDKLDVAINLDGKEWNVAPLALQMLVENAIKHNIISDADPLLVHVFIEEKYLVVENNIQRRKSSLDESAGVGLENIRRRYEMLGTKGIQIEETSDKFRVRVPLILN